MLASARERGYRGPVFMDSDVYRAWEPGRPAAGRAASAGPEEELTLIPYFLWANRGRTQMRVWHDAEL